MKLDMDKVKQENMNLSQLYRDKTRKYQQLENLYGGLKRKEMTAATQSAAYDTADEVLQSASAKANLGTSGHSAFRYSPRNEHLQTHSYNDQNAQVQQHPQQSHFNSGHIGRTHGMGPPPRPNSGIHHLGSGFRMYIFHSISSYY